MAKAIEVVLPNTDHHLCSWHIKQNYRYPADQVPLCTCSKLGLKTRRATMRHRVSNGLGSLLPPREGSGATTCQITLSQLRRLGRLRCGHVPSCYGLPPHTGGLQSGHVPSGPEYGLPSRRALVLPCGP
jgi:hypothetical protein